MRDVGIKAIVTDLDGVLTDGKLYYSVEGMALKCFHTRDAAAARWLYENTDVKLYIVTASEGDRMCRINSERAKFMYLDAPIFQGILDKKAFVEELMKENGIDMKNVAAIGDDILDIGMLEIAGYKACPSDANPLAQRACSVGSNSWVWPCMGGDAFLSEMIYCWRQLGMIKVKNNE